MKVCVDNKEYLLDKEHFGGILNDEENPINNIDEEFILNILEKRNLDFEKAYYSAPCTKCESGGKNKLRAYPFYEYHFYLYTKDRNVVWNSFKVEEEGYSFTRMEREGKADDSYIVSVIICAECGDYEIEVEQFEV